MNLFRYWLIVFLLLGCYQSPAQRRTAKTGQALLDSLLKEKATTFYARKNDTDKVNLLCKIAATYAPINAAQGITYATDAYELAEKADWTYGKGMANINLGHCYLEYKMPDVAIDRFKAAIDIFRGVANKEKMALASGYAILAAQRQNDSKAATSFADSALKWYSEIADSNGIAGILLSSGNIEFNAGEYQRALDKYFPTYGIRQRKGNLSQTGHLCGKIGSCYFYMGLYPDALNWFLKSLKVYEANADTSGIAWLNSNIGNVYNMREEYPKALEYYNKAIALYTQLSDRGGLARVYGNMGVLYADQKNFSKGLEYYAKALEMNRELNIPDETARALANISGTYSDARYYKQAIGTGLQALDLSIAAGSKRLMALSYNVIGAAYLRLLSDTGGAPAPLPDFGIVNPDEVQIPANRQEVIAAGRKYLTLALEVARKEQLLEILLGVYDNLHRLAVLNGESATAYAYYNQFVALHDSMLSTENEQNLTKAALQYQYEKTHYADSLKTAAEEEEHKQRMYLATTYTYGGAAGVLVLLGFSIFLLRNNRQLTRQQKTNDDLLLNILPAGIAEELKSNGSVEARHYNNVTVLYTDFVGFTTTCERLDAQALVNELDACFRKFDEIATRHGLEKIKTIGDAYLAVAGLPGALPDHAQRTISTALEIKNFMEERYFLKGDDTFRVRIGVHTGPLVAGIVGVSKFNYDVWGDTVELAMVMEKYGEPGKVNISDATYFQVGLNYICRYHSTFETKDGRSIKMYFIK